MIDRKIAKDLSTSKETKERGLGDLAGHGGRSCLIRYHAPRVVEVQCTGGKLRSVPAEVHDLRIETVQNLVHDRLGLRLTEINGQIGLTYRRLRHVFQQRLGFNFREYTLQERIVRAINLLIHTEHSMKEIAAKIGYEHPRNFSRTFKRFFGLSPQAFRRGHKG